MKIRIERMLKKAVDKAFKRSFRYQLAVQDICADNSTDYYFVTATIVRGEGKFIREFVAFHRITGVSHMLIYLDGGRDPVARDALSDFVAEGFVELIPWPRFKADRNNQYFAYMHAVAYMRGKCRWLGMIDADEFLHAPSSGDLVGELRQREAYDALSVYSRTFGTGGVKSLKAQELVTETLTRRGKDDHVKNRTQRTIARPEAIEAIRSANTFVLKNTNCIGWDEDGKKVKVTGEAGHGSNHIRINHYFTRSEDDFLEKTQRSYFGKKLYTSKMAGKKLEVAVGDLSCVDDAGLHSYLPDLKRLVWAKGD